MRMLLSTLAVLVALIASAQTLDHPMAASVSQGLGLHESKLLQWGPSTLGYSQIWSGGESRSHGFLLKEFRSQLHPSLSFRARFGLSFQPGTLDAAGENASRFEIPEATLTWMPGENTLVRLQFQQGSLWNSSYDDLGFREFGPWGDPGRELRTTP